MENARLYRDLAVMLLQCAQDAKSAGARDYFIRKAVEAHEVARFLAREGSQPAREITH